ncbi:hypothetical protein APR04_003882 [Promicromonospora umidemergens]|uniref:Secreted protein n=2 Tax=Promicromonospora TaxID=43676 RepID=A0ABP8XH28_9MICO|nr:hypothetical protein [Promicromonospora umidemergens]MCP2284959.1 hypothetical protein [Promicromonospora umidemergens]
MIRAWIRAHRLVAGAILALTMIGIATGLHLSTSEGLAGAHPSPMAPSTPAPEPVLPSRAPDTHEDKSAPDPTPSDFARHVADLLFTWDTTTDDRDAIVEQILAVADPTGVETPGLVTDLEAYLPDEAWWNQLRQYRAAQWFDIETAAVPEEWTDAETRGETDGLPPGATAVTVSGTLHRAGDVAGELQSASADMALTVFVACTEDGCAVLRLGAPGEVLDRERLL